MENEKMMCRAISLAKKSAENDEVPVGAVVLMENGEIFTGENRKMRENDPTAHAEVVAMRAVGRWRLDGATVWVTLEPCAMCTAAMAEARVKKVVFALRDPKFGGCGSTCDLHKKRGALREVEVEEMSEFGEEVREIMRKFFEGKRKRV